MKLSISIQEYNTFATLVLRSEYEDGEDDGNFVVVDSNHRKTETVVFSTSLSTLELAILDAADTIRADKLRMRAENELRAKNE